MTITLTRENVTEALDRAVAKRGEDYVYPALSEAEKSIAFDLTGAIPPSCSYVRDGEASCIVGTVLADLGVPLDVLHQHDYAVAPSATLLLSYLVNDGHIEQVDEGIACALHDAQSRQDQGTPWGRARDIALRTLTKYPVKVEVFA